MGQLSLGMQGDDVSRVHQALLALGRRVPVAEIADRIFGVGTGAVVKALQQELNLPLTGIVDPPTVRAINALLAKLATDPRIVRGSVRDADRKTFTNGFVQVFGQGPNGEQVLGKSPLNGQDGSYQISYQIPQGSPRKADVRIAVLNNNGMAETIPSGESVLTNAGPLEVINFVLAGPTNLPSAEFDLFLSDLKPLVGAKDLAELTEDGTRRDVSVLAIQSGYPPDRVALLVQAHKLAKGTTIPASVFYGMLRQGLPTNESALHAVDPNVRMKALKVAVEQGIVPKEVGGKKVEDYLTDFVPKPAEQLQGLLGRILNANELNTFVGQYLKNSQNPEAFWSQVAADPTWAARAADLKFTAQLGVLTNNNVGLVNGVRAMSDIKQVSDSVRLTEDKWKALIQTQGVGVPDETPGETTEEKITNYVRQILAQVEAAFPTQFFAERLGPSPISTFLKGQPSYDLRRTYPEQFFKQNPAAAQPFSPQDRQQLRTFQRLYRLTGSATDTLALAAKGIQSAHQISRMSRQAFSNQHQEIFSADQANAVYERAVKTNAVALALFGEHAAGLNRTGLQALPKGDNDKKSQYAENSIPDWQTLFGTFDLCGCQECASVHGPAAYLVDILQFLGGRNAQIPLFNRRPDLGDIELSCENTNTPLPLIDLVNEVLENAVAPPPPFVPLTLASALEADLAQTVASVALTAAFSPPLQSGARVETLEAGKRWRVWDEPFAYSVVKEGSELKVIAPSRQTTGSAADRRASPQYRNSAAYAELGRSVYPWNLPFDLPNEEAMIFLAHLGVSRGELMESLRPMPEPFDPNAAIVVRLAAERLSLTDTDRRILVGEPMIPPRQVEDFWGGASVPLPTKVQEVLDRSGLSYAELEALIATWFINPTATVTISAISDAPIDTCDTAKLQITGLTPDVLTRMHRFVRLRRKQDWTIVEIDRLVHALVPDPNTPVLTNEVLVRLDHLHTLSEELRLPWAQTLALWKPIDMAEPGSLYRSLFYNPAVFKPQDEVFTLRTDGRELIHTDTLLADQAPALQATFRLHAEDFAFLLAKTDGWLNLANLSLIYRHATLARQLGLTVQDLTSAVELTGLDPFRADRSQDSVRFVNTIRAIRPSSFGIGQLDYLVRHRFSPTASFVPVDSALAQTLAEVRTSLLKVEAATDADRQALQQSAVIDRISAALEAPADVTGVLLNRVGNAGKTALQLFLELVAITAEPLSRDGARPQFETLEKLLKISKLLQMLDLHGSELNWLFLENGWLTIAPDSPATPVPFANWFSMIQFQQLRRDLALKDGAVEAILSAISAVTFAVDQPGRLVAKKTLVDALSTWLGWATEDLETLIGKSDNVDDLGLWNARIPDDYRINLLARLNRGMTLLKRLGATAARANQWCEASVTDAHAKAIRGTAKAKYDDEAWLKIVVPLQDSLRDKQREASVSYLVASPQPWAMTGKADAKVLYSHFLIDVEMSSCQLTSRIKQAISSVQLFTQRCLMGLESDVQTDDSKWSQWNWMKNFRVWEVNRKIWLYPENWIEPQLRDGKTPFFKELENELLQSDLNDTSAEQAFLRYLEKLDEVARLEIVGEYEDEDKVLHVFGRTFHVPPIYYYRRRGDTNKVWTPWERMELDIEGDHLIPVQWNRKLMMIWPIFTEKTFPKDVEMPEPRGKVQSADHYWEIQLAWSEYQNGRWTGKNLSEPVTFTAYQGEDNVLFGPFVASFQAEHVEMFQRPIHEADPQDLSNADESPDVATANPPSYPPPSDEPRTLVAKELFSFKALVDEANETLSVRGFLRRDYRKAPVIGDAQIACCFGEFQFFGCRKIVTTAPRGQISRLNFPLAPINTKFDYMWFTGNGGGLSLFDGTFPVETHPTLSIFSEVNEYASIVGVPLSTVENKIDIPVLDKAPWKFRILAPHQDLQFLCDRPFFYMDSKRAFMVTSTGSSWEHHRPDLAHWVHGDLAVAWRADYFPPTPSTFGGAVSATASPVVLQPFTVLVPGRNGRRVATQLPPVNLKPIFSPRTLLPTFRTTREYTFVNFHHPYVCKFIKTLNSHGIPALLSLATQQLAAEQSFDVYQPQVRVGKAYPVDEVEFQSGGAYEIYNWELFFHVPLLIADQLSKNQRFEEAQRWFHFIFDPTGASGGDIPQRYWRTKPFYDRLSGDYEAESVKNIEEIVAEGLSPEWNAAIDIWRTNPFSPHAVARLRSTAYQKTVVMKYIDNLLAWADQLFQRETLESINEATHLYVLTAEILGSRPEVIQRNIKPVVQTFNSLSQVGPLGNSLEQIEMLVSDAGEPTATGDSLETPDPPSAGVLYFCVPENDKLLGYWNTVADRLFKIRHCMNIEGQVRQLPLFEPPIDPALLVRAQAAGLSISEVLSDITASLPNYRFSVMLQKANELVAEVRNLGAALLSALEKRDAEALSLLRSGQESRLLQAIRDIRVNQIDEAKANIASIEQSREMAQARKDYYESREKLNGFETASLLLLGASALPIEIAAHLRVLAGIVQHFGSTKIGSPTTAGIEVGGYYVGVALRRQPLHSMLLPVS